METAIAALLVICSVLTTSITQAIKTMLGDKTVYSKNLLASIVSVVVAIAVSAGYMVLNNVPMSPSIVVYIVCLIVLSWLCAMQGYDKVKQMISQMKG